MLKIDFFWTDQFHDMHCIRFCVIVFRGCLRKWWRRDEAKTSISPDSRIWAYINTRRTSGDIKHNSKNNLPKARKTPAYNNFEIFKSFWNSLFPNYRLLCSMFYHCWDKCRLMFFEIKKILKCLVNLKNFVLPFSMLVIPNCEISTFGHKNAKSAFFFKNPSA